MKYGTELYSDKARVFQMEIVAFKKVAPMVNILPTYSIVWTVKQQSSLRDPISSNQRVSGVAWTLSIPINVGTTPAFTGFRGTVA